MEQGHVEAAFPERLGGGGRVEFGDHQVESRMVAGQRDQRRREQGVDRCREGADMDGSAQAGAGGGQ